MINFFEAAGLRRRLWPDGEAKNPGPFSRWRLCVWFWVTACAMLFTPVHPAAAWQNGELLIWMDNERGRAVQQLAGQFQHDLGIKVTVETPERLTDSFPIAAQAGKGPDIVVWAHDKVAEWADGGLLAPVSPAQDFKARFFPIAWQAVSHQHQ
ncbi:MAG: extracellular solute-binding protein, partial [Verrucomicrobia bacterium]|nr:extracellular solute-binding protein [Verrucomicrobiota bacterium]